MKIKGIENFCAHCGSPNLEYSAMTLGGFHYYFKCSNCKQYTEYHYPLKTQILIGIFTVVIFLVYALLMVLAHSPRTGILFYIAFVTLSSALCYKFSWSYIKRIPIQDLPEGAWLISAPPKRLRLVVGLVVGAALVVYLGIFFMHLAQQK